MENRQGYLHAGIDPKQSTLIGNLIVLGSDEGCAVRIDDIRVDARAARIENKGAHFYLRDLRSKVGVLVNGKPILEAILQEGDIIQIAEHEFLFSYQEILETTGVGLRSKNEFWNAQLQTLGNIAQTQFPVLILGPSGTGKEIIADALHKHSNRDQRAFVSVNCSALSETLIESELFGHIRGSFTGAISDRKGAFEAARGGTLFLDEIGDLPYGLQAKLLRALENNEIRPVGADYIVKTYFRVVAATHQNLHQKIQSGEFRADLYFRLNVVTVTPPSLANRMEDFEDLLMTFAKQLKVRFSIPAILRLKKHGWPGNIRELKNTVSRASALFPRTRIEETHIEKILDHGAMALCAGMAAPVDNVSAGHLPVIKEIEKQMIMKRLAANHGNQKRTAVDLGMPKSTLHDRLKFYNIDARRYLPNSF